MKSFIVICLFGFLAVAFSESYTDEYDATNVKEILENEPLLNNYFKCVMDDGPCTAMGAELKSK